MESGKMPPQAIDLEEAVLGALIIERDAYHRCSDVLSPDVFYIDKHQKVYQAIQNLIEDKSPVDMLMVSQELKRMGQLDNVGGMFFVTELTGRVASAAHMERHARVIKEKYIAREIIRLSSELYEKAYSDESDLTKLVDDCVSIPNTIINIVDTGSEIPEFSVHVDGAINALKERIRKNKEGIPIGLPTISKNLDKMIIGMMPEDLIILAARPSVGKSAVALACAEHQAEEGFNPAFFSMEMGAVSLVDRLMLAKSGVDSYNYRSGNINDSELQSINIAASDLRSKNIYIDDKSSVGVEYIRAKVMKLKKKGKCDIVYIDYLQIAATTDDARHLALGKVTGGLKQMARDLKVPVVLLSQVNREASKRAGSRRPGMPDLKESGSIEQDADVIIFIHDPIKAGEIENDGVEYKDGDMILIVAKQRQGRTGDVPIVANETKSNFTDAVTEYGYSSGDSPPIDFYDSERSNTDEQIPFDFDSKF